MPSQLLIGTANKDKARELAELLEGLPWDVKSLADFPAVPEPEEDGATFEENAVKKAQYYGHCFGIACVADDSGLETDALDGAPGVYSARYAGLPSNYENNNTKLLKALENTLWHERTARFVCCAAFIAPGKPPHIERGTVKGHIAMECFGNNGFGYDPLFVPNGYDCTFAEMPPAQKHALSHRGEAFRKIREYLENLA